VIDRRATLTIATFHRPAGLAATLAAVAAMRVPPSWELDVLVIDNDADGSARSVAEAAGVRYVIESARGIPRARNRAVVETADRDWILFLDDDEEPNVDWLERIDAAQRAADADVTIGPSVPAFETEPPAWIRDGGFFERERFATGTAISFWYARTSGVLVRRAAFAHLGERPFDEALLAGSDRGLFSAISEAGGTFVWADDAVVVERVPASRSNLRWLLRRAMRTGNSRSMTLIRVERAGLGRRAKRAVRGVLDVGVGAVRLVLARRTEQRVRALQRAANGVGLTLGALGWLYDEYRVVHGS
jgi:glycosyltransferase involved in cell wall biosynthesis